MAGRRTHTEQDHTDITPGNGVLAEWGIGKTIPANERLLIRPALAGFAEWQVGDDHGEDASDLHSRKYAIGPEINFFWLPPTLFQLNIRALWDFEVRNNPKGRQLVVTLTKSF